MKICEEGMTKQYGRLRDHGMFFNDESQYINGIGTREELGSTYLS